MDGGYVSYVFRANYGAMKISPGKRIWHGDQSEYTPGIRIEFRDHLYSTSDPEIIDILDNHPEYGVSYQRVTSDGEYEIIKQRGSETVRFSRGPAQTMAERLGAPRPVPVDLSPISEVLPQQKKGFPAKRKAGE